jgi:hypothetical protein
MGASHNAGSTADAGIMIDLYMVAAAVIAKLDGTRRDAGMAVDTFVLEDGNHGGQFFHFLTL